MSIRKYDHFYLYRFENFYALAPNEATKKALKAKFINGDPEGMYREWHPNGKRSLRVKYIDGKENGTWTQWYENGKKQFHPFD